MCSSCENATLIIGRSTLLLEKDNRKTTVYNVPCFTCMNCNTSSFDEVILRQYQSHPGSTVTFLRPDETRAVLA